VIAECGPQFYAGLVNYATLNTWAEEELALLTDALPPEIQKAAQRCVVSLEPRPGDDPHDDELEGDELGLFEGTSLLDEPDPVELPRIRLFLENLWDWVENDEQAYRDEVATTYLHELGHFLGWDEEDIAARGLE
jgi:predicted Zn-dependent protease with MMP-like domain